MIYSPDFIVPEHCDKLVSQIDIMPTVLFTNFDYQSNSLVKMFYKYPTNSELLFQPIKI
jgi:arylsulfatase A-like enzyme